MTVIHCGPRPTTDGAEVELNPSKGGRTVIMDISRVEAASGAESAPVVRDLLTLGSYVFLADGAVARATRTDPTAKSWRRDLHMRVPVEEPSRWQAAAPALVRLLEFASDDSWAFEFRPASDERQMKMELESPPDELTPTCVALFSGGLDSLAGALRLADDGERPILASHWTTGTGRTFQDEVAEAIRAIRPAWRFPNPTLHSRRAPGAGESKELTQRSRGVLYLALGVALAVQAGLDRVVVSENGVTSLNLAQSGQSVGAMRSRTTHPKTLALFRGLLVALGLAVRIETPFFDSTKADVIRELVDRAGEQLAHKAVSCSHAMFKQRAIPHCGTCSQCVDRRLAGVAAGWDDALERTQHAVDLFRDPLKDGPDTMYPEQYLRTAVGASELTEDRFASGQDVWRALEDSDEPTADMLRFHALIARHGRQIKEAYKTVFTTNLDDYMAGRLPADGLLRRIGRLDYLREPWRVLADRLVDEITASVRMAFADAPPAREADVQRAIDIAQTAARHNLEREHPTVSFGLIGTRPDFSRDGIDDGGPDLFIEVKLVRSKAQLGTVTDEMLADIPKYAKGTRSALFIVYDAAGVIPHDEQFATPFEGLGPARVRVLR